MWCQSSNQKTNNTQQTNLLHSGTSPIFLLLETNNDEMDFSSLPVVI